MKYILFAIGCIMIGFGIGSAYAESKQINAREYQIRLEPDAAYLYDGNRLVGVVPYNDNATGLDSLILADNL